MNVAKFLEHWKIREHPFRAEEARHDPVFARLDARHTAHPDFEKILGDPAHPSSAIVFGEKGSGKTATRLRIEQEIDAFNTERPFERVLLVAYDDLNPMLDTLTERIGRGKTPGDLLAAFEKIRLADHMDAVLHAAVRAVTDIVLAATPEQVRELRQNDGATRESLMVLQSLYDREPGFEDRHARFRKRLQIKGDSKHFWWRVFSVIGLVLPAAPLLGATLLPETEFSPSLWQVFFYAGLALYALILFVHLFLQPLMRKLEASKLAKELRAVPRSEASYAIALRSLSERERDPSNMPRSEDLDARYVAFERLVEGLRPLGYNGMIVIMDRIDEPTLINGDAKLMRSLVWPILNNKFLQMERVGIKLLLPIELRYELFRESSSFFQEARLDKQSLIERLSWTGAMLYDLCNARIAACTEEGAQATTLSDLFEEDVSRQELVDALDQMQQPRDAFKLLYQAIQEHCQNVTDDQSAFRIPRLTLEGVRKQQVDRLTGLTRGVRPA
ncbi:MAG: hypothetical protein AAGD00_05060 [Planctomycetota bacterium]